jgi:hypothetical protein
MTFTDDFVVSAWVKLSSYQASDVVSRWNGTSGWSLGFTASGQPILTGWNAGSSNQSWVVSYQSVPLNKWVHVTAQLDMSTFTATTTTSYIMLDGVDVPASVSRAGTNPTSLIQAGNLEIGGKNGGTSPFAGKIAQVAIFSAKVTQATIQGYISQSLSGSETSLISAFAFNGNRNDLNTTNANNLNANGSATTTNADSPFGAQADGTVSSTLDYGIITKISYSTNTTVVVQVPEGCTIPTTGGVSALSYSIQKAPYGMPIQEDKWTIQYLQRAGLSFPSTHDTWSAGTVTSTTITIPIGSWNGGFQLNRYLDRAANSWLKAFSSLSTSTTAETDPYWLAQSGGGISNGGNYVWALQTRTGNITLSSATPYYIIVKGYSSDGTLNNNSLDAGSLVSFKLAYL